MCGIDVEPCDGKPTAALFEHEGVAMARVPSMRMVVQGDR